MRTTYIAKEADIVKKWYVIDAEGVTLGVWLPKLHLF